MRNIKLVLAYDGTDFLGWQKTPLGPTIEEALEKVFSQILQEKIALQAASRTDAGVHAEGQVVNFQTKNDKIPLQKLQHSANALLPRSIVIAEIEEAPLSFHPTLDNLGKEYHYFICNGPWQKPKNCAYSWHIPTALDIEAIQKSLPSILGLHDFSSFCNERSLLTKDPICFIESIELSSIEKSRFCFQVRGNRFLFRMVRNLIGTLVYVGLGKISPHEIGIILQSKDRKRAGVTAPAHGLHLMQVFYETNSSQKHNQRLYHVTAK
jgi:tRNA pseudouridine38-40 synthase